MSTGAETRADRRANGSPDHATPPSDSSRWSDWVSSWRIALRMARRDLRRHKGRSAIAAVMVGVPLLILSFLVSIGLATVSSEPRPEHMFGTASAIVRGPVTERILQDGANRNSARTNEAATPIPGFDTEAQASENALAIAALTGGTATPFSEQYLRVQIGERRVRVVNLALDGSQGFGEKVQLVSGRWPSGPAEALVSTQGVRKGLPESGSFELITPDGTETITITGIGTGVTEWGMIPHLISAEPLGPVDPMAAGSGEWLISGREVPFSTVSELGAYGLFVQSAEIVRNPVPTDQLPSALQSMSSADDSLVFLTALAVILALVIGLLVAPAFAVSASRQRRTLALAASNGATARQLRRTVLAQALVLGALSAVIGALLGVAIGAAVQYAIAARSADVRLPIFSVSWLAIGGLVAAAIVAAVTAALFPARRLGRLDIMGVLKGQNVSGAPSRVVPVVGAVIMVVGAVLLIWGARQSSGGDYTVAFGAIALVVGALSLIPTALVAIGRLGAALPVPLRMASRDAARQRTRSVPTVAAVMGGVAALTIGLIAGFSDAKESEVLYSPRTIMGQGKVSLYDDLSDEALEAAKAVVRERIPDATITPFTVTGSDYFVESAGPQPFVVLAKPECTGEQAVFDKEHQDAQEAAFEAAADQDGFVWTDSPCTGLGGPSGVGGEIVALPAAAIVERLQLTGAEAEQARAGAVFAVRDILGPEAVAYSGTFAHDASTGMPSDITVTGQTTVPVVIVPESATRNGAMFEPGTTAALVSSEQVEKAGWPTVTYGFLIDAPDGISDDQRTAISERLGDADLYVESGWRDATTLFFTVLVAAVAFLLLVVILTATALSMAEQRTDDSTLAAVGATRGTRRGIAAAQAFALSIVGAILGLVVGIVPGIAFAYPLTRSVNYSVDPPVATGPFLAIPYAWLAFIAVGVPVLAALFSALAVRRAPVVTRRAD